MSYTQKNHSLIRKDNAGYPNLSINNIHLARALRCAELPFFHAIHIRFSSHLSPTSTSFQQDSIRLFGHSMERLTCNVSGKVDLGQKAARHTNQAEL
jgi:hypothetical protein